MKYVGISRIIKPRTHFTSLERRYYGMLKSMDVFYIPQYELDGRYYDAFLPDYNALIEFDGTFWHPKSIDECKYECQFKNLKVDRIKNDIAKVNGYTLIRIREESPIEMDDLKKILKEIKK